MFKRTFFLFIFLFFGALYLQADPNKLAYKGYINDYTGTLSNQDVQYLNHIAKQFDQAKKIQLVLVVIDSVGDESIEEYSNKLYESWGIGQKDSDLGALFITAIKDKKMRIEVGYGLEGVIPDAKAGDILRQYVTPFYKQGEMAKGIMNGYLALAKIVATEYKIPIKTPQASTPTHSRQNQKGGIGELIFMLIVGYFLLFTRMGRRMLPFIFLASLGSRHSGSSFGGFGGSSFGGFGGGLSGGGGASSSW